MKSMMTSRLRETAAGFTLLEVLIAIVVVAFGLLGLAGLQVFALRNNASAAQRVTASNLTVDIVDRMKANYLGVVAGNYNGPTAAAYAGPAVSTCASKGGACSAANLATTDLFEWQQRVAATLPGGVGRVCVDSAPSTANTPAGSAGCNGLGINGYVVKIWWYDERGRGTGTGTLKNVYTIFNP
jgi:type IV pilus assembly protein PilV